MSDLLSGLASLTKQVTSNISTYEIRKISEKVQGMVMNFTDAEILVREATNEDPWGPTGPQMKEISNLTFQYEVFTQVSEMLWRRMFEDNKYAWRRVYKSLTLLNYLLQHGSERVISSAREHIYQMRSLEHYKFTDEKGKDQGINIRHRAGIILELLQDEEKLRQERKKAKNDSKERYQGYTSDDIRMGRGGTFNRSSPKNDDWEPPKRKSSFEDHNSYNKQEVNSFAFPDDVGRRNSYSPELGFRNDKEEEDDDGFGDFASARSAASAPTQVNTKKVARISGVVPIVPPPPGSSGTPSKTASNTTTPASFDLLGLDASAPEAPTHTDFFSSPPVAVNTSISRPPRPPSGGAPAVDLFAMPPATNTLQPSPNKVDDLFGSSAMTPSNDLFSNAPPAPQQNNNVDLFGSEWSSPAAPTQTSNVSSFGGLDSFGDFGSVTATAQPTKSQSLSPMAVNAQMPISQTPTNVKPQPDAKVGTTWAGAGGLIDLDNLGGKSSQVKQSPSLNQMATKPSTPSKSGW